MLFGGGLQPVNSPRRPVTNPSARILAPALVGPSPTRHGTGGSSLLTGFCLIALVFFSEQVMLDSVRSTLRVPRKFNRTEL